MPWYYYVLHFIAGALLANGVPHFVQGICGNRFQSPFASPPGEGESSAIINVVWGWFNLAVAGVLLTLFPPGPPLIGSWVALAVGALISALWLAMHFGKVRTVGPNP
jgi:hypothetical protein